jgi:hypothetical protein
VHEASTEEDAEEGEDEIVEEGVVEEGILSVEVRRGREDVSLLLVVFCCVDVKKNQQ